MILIIDDDKEYLMLLCEALEDAFRVQCANSLNAAELLLQQHKTFDIALVDECIGDERGSQWIKAQVADRRAVSSFVLYSGLATEETIIKGLECGADDFLVKPMPLSALKNKLHKLIQYQEQIHLFESEINDKDRVINVSMAQASKYGSCMQLTSRLNKCFSIENIKDELFSFFYSMKLHGCLAFYPLHGEPLFFHSEKMICSPVEIGALKLLKDKPRVHRFGNRALFNHNLASILIFHLEEGAVDTDIYIDALASVIECVGARMTFLAYQESLVKVQAEIQQAVSTTKEMVESSKQHQQEVMNEIVQNIGMSFHILDMTMEQEEYLTNLVHNALRKHTQDDLNFFSVSQLLDSALDSVEGLSQFDDESTSTDTAQNVEEDELF